MSLTKQTNIENIEIMKNGVIQMRETTYVFENAVEISKTHFRSTFAPSADTSQLPEQVKKIANVVWTADVIAAFDRDNQITNI